MNTLSDIFNIGIDVLKALKLDLGFGLSSFSLYDLAWGMLAVAVLMYLFNEATGGD